ncbi:MAG: hypothetical protein ACPL5F_13725 [Moorellaceae bacterium]
MLAFEVPKVVSAEIVEGPSPVYEEYKAGKTVEWLRWQVKGWLSVDAEKVLYSLPKPPMDWVAFWRRYGPLVAPYAPTWAKGLLGEGWHYAPLETAQNALDLLRLLYGQQTIYPKGGRETLELQVFLEELYDYLPEWVREHSKPVKEILIVAKEGRLKAVLPSQVRPWERDYALRFPVKKGEVESGKRQGGPFEGRVIITPGKGEVTLLLPCLFPILLDHILQGHIKQNLCACGCGQVAPPGRKYADPSHRKRLWWRLNRGKGDLPLDV